VVDERVLSWWECSCFKWAGNVGGKRCGGVVWIVAKRPCCFVNFFVGLVKKGRR